MTAGGEAIGDPGTYPDEYVDNWSDPAMQQAMACFGEGTMTWIGFCSAEGHAPPGGWTVAMFECPEVYRKALLDAALANVRVITGGSYGVPWQGLMRDFREFAVPFRMLPYGALQSFDGRIEPRLSDVVVRQVGRHYAVFNLGRREVEAELTSPAGRGSHLYDLSDGTPEAIAGPARTQSLQARLRLAPLSLRTLARL